MSETNEEKMTHNPPTLADMLTALLLIEERQRRITKAKAAERAATLIHETKTEGRTPRPFRTNPHEN